MKKCNYIYDYIYSLETKKIKVNKDIKKAIKLVKKILSDETIYIDNDKTEKAKELIERYFEFELFPWELFILGLVHCYYKKTNEVVFREFLIMVGRGNGKNGFISGLSWYLTTHYHGIREYDIDIIANSENQAKTSFMDIYNILEKTKVKSKKFFKWTLTAVRNKKTNSVIQFNTSNPETKDGKRSACLIFDEIHGYRDYEMMNVYVSGFGKKENSRIFKITTNGYVRNGVLDKELEYSEKVLNGEIPFSGILPLIYRIDKLDEMHDEENWEKANPSYYYLPSLQAEMRTVYSQMEFKPNLERDFVTKRMNLSGEETDRPAIPFEQVKKACSGAIPLDDLIGQECIIGIDYATLTDFCSVGAYFKHNNKRYWYEHSFVCEKALNIPSRRIKFPVRDVAKQGYITILKTEIIEPDIIAKYVFELSQKYRVLKIACDDYRLDLLRPAFKEYNFELDKVRTGKFTHARVAPLIENIFATENICMGDNPTMRWYIGNTKTDVDEKANIEYLKIEPRLRKTDGFFAFINAVNFDSLLTFSNPVNYDTTLKTYHY